MTRRPAQGRTRFRPLLVLLALVLVAGSACTSGDAPAPAPAGSPTATAAPLSTGPPVTLAPAEPCPRAPAYLHHETLFGTHVSTRERNYEEALAVLDETFGRMPAVRVFDPGPPPPRSWETRGPLFSGRRVVYSFRIPPAQVLSGAYDERLLAFFRDVPDDVELFWTYYHEVEPLIEGGAFTAREFRSAFRHVVDLARQACRPDIYPTLVLTGYTLSERSGRDWRTFYPGDDYVSVMAWDPYNRASSHPTDYASPEELFGPAVEASRLAGKPFGIAETGSRLIRSDAAGRQRAQWLDASARYLEAQEAAFVTYYHSVGVSGADYRLLDAPSIRAWRRWVSGG